MLLKSIESAFMVWLDTKVKTLVNKRLNKIMVTVSEVQARIEAIEATVASERAQVIAAVEEYIDRIAELIEAGSENGQDLSVLIDELDALEDRIKGIYEAEPVPVPLPNPSI